MSIMDVNLMLRATAAGALNANELTPASLDFGGPDQHPLTYVAIFPDLATGTTPTCNIVIQESDDNSNWRNALSFAEASDADTPTKKFVTGKLDGRYRRFTATLVGAAADFGIVLIAPVIGGTYEDF